MWSIRKYAAVANLMASIMKVANLWYQEEELETTLQFIEIQIKRIREEVK